MRSCFGNIDGIGCCGSWLNPAFQRVRAIGQPGKEHLIAMIQGSSIHGFSLSTHAYLPVRPQDAPPLNDAATVTKYDNVNGAYSLKSKHH